MSRISGIKYIKWKKKNEKKKWMKKMKKLKSKWIIYTIFSEMLLDCNTTELIL